MNTTVRRHLARVEQTIGHRGYVPVVLALVLIAVSQYSVPLLHSLAEIVTAIVAVTAFVVAWNSYPFSRNDFLMYLGCGYFWIGALDLVYSFMSPGMPWSAAAGASAPARLWIATRHVEALVLLTSPVFLLRPLRRARAFVFFAVVALALPALILSGRLADTRLGGPELARLRSANEYVIVAVLAGAMMHLWYRRALVDARTLALVLTATAFTAAADLSFALPASAGGSFDLPGYLFRLFAFWLIYAALVEFTLTQPLRVLARTANIYDAVPDPILVVDRSAIVRGLNEAACTAAGLPRERVLGQSCHALFHPPELPPGQCPVCRAIGRGEALAAEELRFAGNGRRIEVTLSPIGDVLGGTSGTGVRGPQRKDGLVAASPVVWAEGAAGMVHVSHDVTVRAAAEEAARRSEDKFRALVNGTNDVIFIHDWEGRILEVNEPATDLLGYHTDELRRMSLRDIDSPEFAAMMPARLEQLRRYGRAVFETAHVTRGGKVIPVEVSARAFEYNGAPAVLSVARDISGRKQAEAAVWESTRRFATLLAASPVGVFETDEHGSCVYVNERWQEIAGLAPAQAAGDGWIGALHLEDREESMTQWNRALRDGALFRREFRVVRPDGVVSWVYGLAAPLRERGGDIIGYVGTFTDVTESKLADIRLHKVNRALKTLGSGNEVLVHAIDEAELLREMCRVIVGVGGYRMAWVGFAEHDDRKSVRPMAQSGNDEDYLGRARISWADTEHGRGPTGTAIRTRTRQIVRSALTDPRFAPWRAEALERGYASIISLPLANGSGEAFGALTIHANDVDAFDDEEVRLLEELANDLSYGIVNLRARADRREGAEKLRRSLEDTIQVVATTVEIRDPYTAGHQKRVASLAEAIARELGLSEERIHGLHLAGIVHDIGKVSAPAEILSKPGRLNSIEYNLIQMHSQSGYEILKDVEFPWPIAQMVLQHHERFDGSGYPKGLKGDEILLEARILAVADVVESMSSHRPYRAGLGLEAALEEIRTHRGTDYDPAVVDACLRLFSENRFGFDRATPA